VYKISAIVID